MENKKIKRQAQVIFIVYNTWVTVIAFRKV